MRRAQYLDLGGVCPRVDAMGRLPRLDLARHPERTRVGAQQLHARGNPKVRPAGAAQAVSRTALDAGPSNAVAGGATAGRLRDGPELAQGSWHRFRGAARLSTLGASLADAPSGRSRGFLRV